MHTIQLDQISAQLWRNGAGLTRLIASGVAGRTAAGQTLRSPPHIDEFDWRISLAEIGGDGPFSLFAGIDRCAVLLGQRGITLSGSSGAVYLQALQPLSFAGETELQARRDPGMTTPRILNLMVRRHTMRSEVSVIDASYRCPAAASLFVLIAAGRWEFVAPDQSSGTLLSVGQAGLVHALAAGAILRPMAAELAPKAVLICLHRPG